MQQQIRIDPYVQNKNPMALISKMHCLSSKTHDWVLDILCYKLINQFIDCGIY